MWMGTFLDWIGGVGVLNIGYSNPEVVEAVKARRTNISTASLMSMYMKDM